MKSGPVTGTGDTAVASGVECLEFEKPLLRIQNDIAEMEQEQRETSRDLTTDIKQQRSRFKTTLKRLYAGLTPWETVLVARHPKRPQSTDYLRLAFRDFCELHGDRIFGDDGALLLDVDGKPRRIYSGVLASVGPAVE